jgi:2,3-bisphosphoglycerate-independent phosphoglycerate mutase
MDSTSLAPRRPTLLIILDGFGVNPSDSNNAISAANTPKFDALFSRYPHTTIDTSGPAVGLPEGQMGNSEVGHMTLGCGSIVRQDLVVISEAARDGSLFENAALTAAARTARKSDRPLHLLGLVSDGGVHSHLEHILALIEICKREGARPLLHAITDGRDTAPRCASKFLPELESALRETQGAIASVCGRFYAMDRDNRWQRVQIAWNALVRGEGRKAPSAAVAIETAWAAGEGDEFIKPVILPEFEAMAAGDQVIFFNFRNDRPRELSEALAFAEFAHFDRSRAMDEKPFAPVALTTMTRYRSTYPFPVAFDKEAPAITLGELLEAAGIQQFHASETEKYPHVTFFFNGGRETPFDGEHRALIPSPSVSTYDLQPEMSAGQVADAVIAALETNRYGFVLVNFANGDMVGHTGVWPATVKAVETLDLEAGRVIDSALTMGYSVVLTADHGNCDMMVDPVTHEPHTQHTTFPVPCLVIDSEPWRLADGCGLASIAPTILQLMGLRQPTAMSGRSLLVESMGTSSS